MGQIKNIKLHIVTDIKSSLSQLQVQLVTMYTSQDLNDLKCDLEEYERVLATVNRPNVRASIADSISTLKTNIRQITDEIAKNNKETTKAEEKPPTTTTTTKQNLFTAKISNYGRDESAKLIVSMKKVDSRMWGCLTDAE